MFPRFGTGRRSIQLMLTQTRPKYSQRYRDGKYQSCNTVTEFRNKPSCWYPSPSFTPLPADTPSLSVTPPPPIPLLPRHPALRHLHSAPPPPCWFLSSSDRRSRSQYSGYPAATPGCPRPDRSNYFTVSPIAPWSPASPSYAGQLVAERWH